MFFIREPHEFSRIGSGFAGEFHCRLYSYLFAQFDSIAPAFSPFGPTVGCSTSCPPRHSVVVHMGGSCGDRLAEEDLSVPGGSLRARKFLTFMEFEERRSALASGE